MRFWTAAYVAISDWRLGLAYYGGVVIVLIYGVWAVIVNRGFLEMDDIQGVCRSDLSVLSSSKGACVGVPCRTVPPAEVEAGVGLGQAFVATHISESLESCSDTFCLEAREVLKSEHFFARGIENYTLTASCNAQSFRFFSEECHQDMRYTKVQPGQGFLHNNVSVEKRSACPFATANLKAHGRLLGPGGVVLRHVLVGKEDSFDLQDWLLAAGVSLESPSDAPDAEPGSTLRRVGLVLVVNFVYTNQPHEFGLFDHFLDSTSPSIEYDIQVQRVAEASYHVHKSTVHETSDGQASVREVRVSHGILIRFMQTGQLGRFSWSKFIDQLVLKLGLLSLLQLGIDLLWQYVLPFLNIDYNKQVYRWTVRNSRCTPKDYQ